MGLSEPAIATPSRTIIDPRTNKPVGADDPFFPTSTASLPTRDFWSPRPTT